VRLFGPLVRVLFRPTLAGVEHLPANGPYLLVANHSAGMGVAEIASLALLLAPRVTDHPIAGFAHPVSFRLWPLRPFVEMVGAVPSTYDDAYRTLESGVPLLVFPGGDHETLRPVWQAHRVDFGGRKGFLRIAAQANVRIVPMGIRGSHFTAPMLVRAKWLAWFFVIPRLAGIKRWGISLLGLLGCLAIAMAPLSVPLRLAGCWVWLASPFVYLPWIPATIRMRIGEPLSRLDDDLDVALGEVEAAVQALVR